MTRHAQVFAFALFLAACGDDTAPSEPVESGGVCDAGVSERCYCPDGRMSTKECTRGVRYGACDCSYADAGSDSA